MARATNTHLFRVPHSAATRHCLQKLQWCQVKLTPRMWSFSTPKMQRCFRRFQEHLARGD
jgi:hypothetical protein